MGLGGLVLIAAAVNKGGGKAKPPSAWDPDFKDKGPGPKIKPAGTNPEADNPEIDIESIGQVIGKWGKIGTEDMPFAIPVILCAVVLVFGGLLALSPRNNG